MLDRFLSRYRHVYAGFFVVLIHLVIGAWFLHPRMHRTSVPFQDPVWAAIEVVDPGVQDASAQPKIEQPSPSEAVLPQAPPAMKAVPTQASDIVQPTSTQQPEVEQSKTVQPSESSGTLSGPLPRAPIPEAEGPPVAFVPAATEPTLKPAESSPDKLPCLRGTQGPDGSKRAVKCPGPDPQDQ